MYPVSAEAFIASCNLTLALLMNHKFTVFYVIVADL